MAVERMDHVGIIVDDLAAATTFFTELGLEVGSEMSIEGEPVDRIIGLEGVSNKVAMVKTPDGRQCLELIEFLVPPSEPGDPGAPANTLGLRHVTFAVDDLEDTLARLRPHGAELVGEVVRYGNSYVLAYIRGPAGIIVELAEKIS